MKRTQKSEKNPAASDEERGCNEKKARDGEYEENFEKNDS